MARLIEDVVMKITRAQSLTSTLASSDTFTGRVRMETLFSNEAPARTKGAYVTFDPSARTFWHTHPLGQTIIITHGSGRVQRWGGPVEIVSIGDVVFFEPHEKHWHGGGLETAMTHLTVGEVLDGKSADWLEEVTDQQYRGG